MKNSVTKVITLKASEFDVFGYIAYDEYENEIVVVFRGSNSGTADIKSWLSNLRGDWANFGASLGSLVHSGWYTAYTHVKEKLLTEV